jgi:L-malate glycosyltransferase
LKVLYVSSNGGIHDYRFLKKMVEEYEVLFLHYAALNIIDEIDKLKHLQIISKKPAFKSFPLASEVSHFKKVVHEFKPDIIHTGYVWQVGILAALQNFHPHLSMPWGSDILTEPDESYLKKKLVAKVMKQSDHVQCDADFVKQKIIKDYGTAKDKITVFPWGIDLNLFKKDDKQSNRTKLNLDKDKFIVMFNRHLEPVYGVNDLLEGFRQFANDKDDVLLLMLSEGSERNITVKFIAESKLENKIHLIGRVVNKELPLFLNSSDVYISTSLSDGSSLSLLEAMACGLGIVVTDVPAIREWIDSSNGLVVNKKNPNEIASALNNYYNNRKLITDHGEENIKIAVQRADWDKNYMILKDIYQKLYDAK